MSVCDHLVLCIWETLKRIFLTCVVKTLLLLDLCTCVCFCMKNVAYRQLLVWSICCQYDVLFETTLLIPIVWHDSLWQNVSVYYVYSNRNLSQKSDFMFNGIKTIFTNKSFLLHAFKQILYSEPLYITNHKPPQCKNRQGGSAITFWVRFRSNPKMQQQKWSS